jgi:hypothetical protein
MNPEKLKRAIAIATDAVSSMNDKDLKLKSYEVILNNLLKSELSQETVSQMSPPKEDNLNTNSYQLLSKKLDCDENVLRDFIELGERPRLLFKINKDNAIEQQITFLLIFLSVNKICYGDQEIKSSTLREVLAIHQIQAINNLSTNVKKFGRFIVHKSGKIGSTNTSYRITEKGNSYGLSLLSEIIKGKNASELDLKFLGAKISKRNKYTSKVGNEIENLLNEGFFNEHKKSNEVVAELRKRGFFNRRQDIDAYLRQVLLGKKLLREEINKKWSYVIKR